MREYLAATNEFDYQHTVDAALAGNLQALNACVECCDRHALPGRIALFWEGKDGRSATSTFTELQEQAARLPTSCWPEASSAVTRWRACCRVPPNCWWWC